MAYIKTNWIDDETVVNATRMNNIETGIENLQNVPLLAVSDTAPSECEEGDKYFNTTSKKIFTATGHNTWGSTGEDPKDGMLYIVFSTKTTYSLDNGDLISVGGGGAEIAISTTQPSEGEVLWINPEDTPSGSLNPITNTYSEATDKGYSCNYLNNSDSYSTSEIKTNKRWIDGKPIYRKVVDIGDMTSPVNHNITNLGTIINFMGIVRGGDSSPYDAYFPVSFANKNGLEYQISEFIQGSQVKFNKGSGLTIVSGYLIIEYTKTTD